MASPRTVPAAQRHGRFRTRDSTSLDRPTEDYIARRDLEETAAGLPSACPKEFSATAATPA